MSSTFFGLNVARSGLFASQRALNITGHNIANANTPGFSRQRLNMTQSLPMSLAGGQGMLGSGVDTHSIQQIRDQYLDFKIRKENTPLGEWQTRAESLSQIEAIFNEPSKSGIRTVMDEFFASVSELSKSDKADDLTVRAQVRERAVTLTKTLNHMYNQLESMRQNTDFAVKTTVDQINGYAEQISALNKQIFTYEADGSNANDLRDQRNLLIDQLSKLVDIEVQETPVAGNNTNATTMRISINGMALVSHYNHTKLKTTAVETNDPYLGKSELLKVTWEDGSAFNCKSGSLKGLLDIRDEISGNEKGIPYYMAELNRFTTVFAARFNMQHGQGYGLSGAGTGIPFFNKPELNYDLYPKGYEQVNVNTLGSSDQDKINRFETLNPGCTIFKMVQEETKYATADFDGNQNFSAASKILINGKEIPLTNVKALTGSPVNMADVITALNSDIKEVYDGQAYGGKTFTVESNGDKLVIKGANNTVDLTGSDAASLALLGFAPNGDSWYKVPVVTAKEINISAEIEKDLNKIAAAKHHLDGNTTSGLPGDGSNALALNNIRQDAGMFTWGNPDNFFKSLISNLGVDSQNAQRMTTNQQVLVDQIDSRRQSISGVSLDEEMANLVKFQHAYNASARMITAVDEMLDKIINGMGMVGR